MTDTHDLQTHKPDTLDTARALAHSAAQFLTRAARANLPAQPDDSHSNLGWDRAGRHFLSQPLPGKEGACFVTLGLFPFRLGFTGGPATTTFLDLDGVSQQEAQNWLDGKLAEAGLQVSAPIALPYSLPQDVSAIDRYQTQSQSGQLAALSAWFDLANGALTRFTEERNKLGLEPGPSAVRCWPHHFDIATYVSLESGDAETARGIGVGMSPGDESYGLPYFYVNPWPHLDPVSLPAAPRPGHWHTEGFVGAIATAEEILTLEDTSTALSAFLEGAFAIGLLKLRNS
ncbi:MAG: hypothetical protein ABJN26_08885 [Stappiaceae bacterium]